MFNDTWTALISRMRGKPMDALTERAVYLMERIRDQDSIAFVLTFPFSDDPREQLVMTCGALERLRSCELEFRIRQRREAREAIGTYLERTGLSIEAFRAQLRAQEPTS